MKYKSTKNSLFFFSILLFSCLSPSKKYLNGQCQKIAPRSSPFVLNVYLKERHHDTIVLTFRVTNVSGRQELLYTGHLFPSFCIINDSTLSIWQIAIKSGFVEPKAKDRTGKSLITCDNCVEFFRQSGKFVELGQYNFYEFDLKREVKNLHLKPKGFQLKIVSGIYIHETINHYCPKIWTGSVGAYSELVLN